MYHAPQVELPGLRTQDIFCKSEKEALEGTEGSGAKGSQRQRRLKLFAVVNSEDDMMRLQRVGQEGAEELFMQGAQIYCANAADIELAHLCTVWISLNGPSLTEYSLLAGCLYPSSGKAAKAEGRRMAQRFGPITGWKATYNGSEPELIVSTELADYNIMTCVNEYREHYNDVREQVAVCHSIVQALKGKDAKEAEQSSFESVLAAVSRAKAVKGYMSVRDAVLLNGSFILAQIPAMQSVLGSAGNLENSAFVTELMAEVCHSPTMPVCSCFPHIVCTSKSANEQM